MKFFGKIFIVSIIFSLVSMASGFCAQAASFDSPTTGMDMPDMGAHTLPIEEMLAQGVKVQVLSMPMDHSWNTCSFECRNLLPQSLSIKKFQEKEKLTLVAFSSDLEQPSLGGGNASLGWDPGAPPSTGVLLSVHKRE